MHVHTRDGTAVASQQDGLLPLTQHALVIWNDIACHDFAGPALVRRLDREQSDYKC
jgi:ribulose-5-phosphate 4-epimerase/fuculose-1-phosphate aldolase